MRHFIYLLTFCFALLIPQFATAGSTPTKPTHPQTEKPSKVQQWLLKKALKKQQRIQQNPKKKARWERRVREDDPRPLHWSTKVCLILAFLFPFPPRALIFSIIGIFKSGKNKPFKGKGLTIGALVYSFVIYAISILILLLLINNIISVFFLPFG